MQPKRTMLKEPMTLAPLHARPRGLQCPAEAPARPDVMQPKCTVLKEAMTRGRPHAPRHALQHHAAAPARVVAKNPKRILLTHVRGHAIQHHAASLGRAGPSSWLIPRRECPRFLAAKEGTPLPLPRLTRPLTNQAVVLIARVTPLR